MVNGILHRLIKLGGCAMNENIVIKKYIDCAIEYDKYIKSGNSRKANKFHKKLMNIFKELEEIGQEGLLIKLHNHENIAVRLWSASHTIKNEYERSLSILKEITRSSEIHSLTAEAIIDIFEKS